MNFRHKLNLCWRVLRFKPDNLYGHAERELPASTDDMQVEMNRDLLELIAVFSTQGHSGFSAGYANTCLHTLLDFKPLGPLTGEDREWSEPFDYDGTCQNLRCGNVFKRADGTAYDIDGRVFRTPSGATYTSIDSRVEVTFPYTPNTEYVDVPG